MRISDEKIEEIRNATDIVDYVGRFVKLRKRGKNYLGVCPFHNEKTPSFNVSTDKQMYYCFGCHKGGDVIKFVMEWDKLAYPEAIEFLAERSGIQLEHGKRDAEEANETEQLYSACRFAGRYFYANLQQAEGKFALDYLHARGFTDKTITTFGLGYSLRAWEALLEKAKEEGITPEHLAKVGLLRTRDDGSHYDAFRGRTMFPIFSATGKVIAFGARKIYDDDTVQGKYINSPETVIYKKGRVLYGLSQSKEAIRERDSVILVEGYADLISVYQAGVKNIVASSGTALTDEQIKLLARYAKNVVFVYDADSAGSAAMVRGIDLILEQNLDVRIVALPAGEDPDSYVTANGGEAFRALVAKAQSFIEFKAFTFKREGKFNTPEGRADAVRALVQTIAKVADPLKQSFFIRDVAEKFNLYESSLYTELEKYTKKVPEKLHAPAPIPHVTDVTPTAQGSAGNAGSAGSLGNAGSAENVGNAGSAGRAKPIELMTEEKELLSALFEDPNSMVEFIFGQIQLDEFVSIVGKTIALTILEEYEHEGRVDARAIHAATMNEAMRTTIADCSFNRYQLSEKWDSIGHRSRDTRLFEQALGAIKSLKRKNIETEIAANRRTMKDAQLQGLDVLPLLQCEKELYQRKAVVEDMQLEMLKK